VSSLCARVRPRSVLPKTETRTEPLVITRVPSRVRVRGVTNLGIARRSVNVVLA
jgi:hypothetical protein